MSIVKKLSTELHSLADQIHSNVFSGEEKAVIANRLYEISKALEDLPLDAMDQDVLKPKEKNGGVNPNDPLNGNYTTEGPQGISGIPGPTGEQVLDDKSQITKSDDTAAEQPGKDNVVFNVKAGETAEHDAIGEQGTADPGSIVEDESPL